MTMVPRRCIDCGRYVGWVVLTLNLAMFLVKGAFAIISQSRSLLTDAFQSLANVIVTIVVLTGLRLASRGADKRYPYGYGKIEFLASGIVNMLLMLAAIWFIIASFRGMLMTDPEKAPGLIAIVAAAISIIGNEIAFRYGRCAGERLGSSSILANAMVNRADEATSVAVIIAVLGANLGIRRLDHIVAIAICILIIKVILGGVQKAIKGLMDVSLCREELHIRNLAEDVEGVERIGDVKARLIGRQLWVDLSVFVPDDWDLSSGLDTARKIKRVLRRKMGSISEVTVRLLPAGSADDQEPGTRREPTGARRGQEQICAL